MGSGHHRPEPFYEKYIGHMNINVTERCYAHTRRDSAVKGIKALDEAYNL
jgi:hypothetical protein